MKHLAILILASLVVVGCNAGDGGDDAAKKIQVTEQPVDNATVKDAMAAQGDNVKTNAPVINDPKQAQPGQSYRIEPANPDDPKYKADPRLSGGG